MKKGRYGVMSSSIEQHFNPYHMFVEISAREDFNPEKIVQQVCIHETILLKCYPCILWFQIKTHFC